MTVISDGHGTLLIGSTSLYFCLMGFSIFVELLFGIQSESQWVSK